MKEKCAKDISIRGINGSKNLEEVRMKTILENRKAVKKALNYFRDQKIPLLKQELSVISGLSVSTLNRSPYKEIITEYKDEEKVLLTPNLKQEFSAIVKENRILKQEKKELEEKYKRLKKEYRFTKEMLGF